LLPCEFVFSGRRGRRPYKDYLLQNYSLNGQGLGGARPLAAAKAKFNFVPTVYPFLWSFLLVFLCESF
jgi:hypothetical protein